MFGSLSRPVRIVLVLSLALNLFFVGVVAADALAGRGFLRGNLLHVAGLSDPPPPRGNRQFSPRQLRAVLSDEDQAVLDRRMEANRGKVRDRLSGMADARRELVAAIRAEPFDRGRLDAAFAAVREREGRIAAEVHTLMSEVIGDLGPEAREKIAELVARPGRPGRPGGPGPRER